VDKTMLAESSLKLAGDSRYHSLGCGLLGYIKKRAQSTFFYKPNENKYEAKHEE